MHKYYENKDAVEHSCCWDTAIFSEVEEGQGIYFGNQKMILECNDEDVNFILKALNSTSRLPKDRELKLRGRTYIMEEKQVTVVIEVCEQIGPDNFKMKRFSRNFAISRPMKDMIMWAENMGIKNASVSSLRFHDYTGAST